MRRPSGFGQIVDPSHGAPQWERETVACKHCGKHVWVKPGTGATVYLILHLHRGTTPAHWVEEPGAFCLCCMGPVCLPCHDIGTCRPIEQWLAQQEATSVQRG